MALVRKTIQQFGGLERGRFKNHRKGRMLPDGVEYVNSWIEENLQKCYQIMSSESIEKLYEWIENWKDLVNFEIIPVLSSEEAVNLQNLHQERE